MNIEHRPEIAPEGTIWVGPDAFWMFIGGRWELLWGRESNKDGPGDDGPKAA